MGVKIFWESTRINLKKSLNTLSHTFLFYPLKTFYLVSSLCLSFLYSLLLLRAFLKLWKLISTHIRF
ncbi:Hypothetical protein BN2458_PEG0141 [Helicobacter typhlonius]|uniref:Uncharacterized protein n=1 Tax=Helicobacter typhlonius TaxID=76936 RepID=A0A0S4PUA0_9HELI|nr:Hypothetical protein BN2458_PEG0141 [Helicobacter typhlonius]